jgi:hypothetical protein
MIIRWMANANKLTNNNLTMLTPLKIRLMKVKLLMDTTIRFVLSELALLSDWVNLHNRCLAREMVTLIPIQAPVAPPIEEMYYY